MTIPVIWQTYAPNTIARGQWDMSMLERLFDGTLWKVPSGFTFQHYEGFDALPEPTEIAVVVIPARHQVAHLEELNRDLLRLNKVLLILVGDEEGVFDWRKVEHTAVKFWVMLPKPGVEYPAGTRFIGDGPAPDAYTIMPIYESPDKYLDWFFAGQVTHSRRVECVKRLRRLKGGKLVETSGFTQGLPHDKYYQWMEFAKVVPCPSGPETPDTFRLYEALEAGCVPIADDLTPRAGDEGGYWAMVYPDAPFPVLKDYDDLPGYIKDAVGQYPRLNNRIGAWWLQTKRKLAYQLHEDLVELTGQEPQSLAVDDLVTVLIPCSPIPSHPDTAILDETIASVRHHLPNCEILLSLDGVRKEQEHYRVVYEQFIQRVLWKCQHEWRNVVAYIHDEHTHQVGMARKALEYVQTPLLLYVESDTPLVTDEPIDWDGLTKAILSGEANVIRLAFEAKVLEEHRHMMLDDNPTDVGGVPLLRTAQWSNRPHLSSASFYRHMLDTYFSPNAVCFTEDKVHGELHQAYLQDGVMGWYRWRVWIYHPDGNIKRSYHTDGREGQEKWDNLQVF